ncbi:FUSC family protein [Jatrophihabitans sp. DSM 45814]
MQLPAARETLNRVRVDGPVMHRLGQQLWPAAPQVLRIVIAAAVSWQLCIWLGASHPPVYAAVVPLVALRDDPYSAFNVSLDRLIGVVGGLALGLVVVHWLGPTAVSVAIVLAVGLFGGSILRIGGSLNVQVAVSALLAFASSDPSAYAYARLWETAVGAAVTVVLAPLLRPPNARATITASLRSVGEDLAATLDSACNQVTAVMSVATADVAGPALEKIRDQCRLVEDRARALPAEYARAEHSVRINPLRRSDRQPIAALACPIAIAVELARGTRQFVDEVADLSKREDLRADWPSLGNPLAGLVTPIAETIRIGLKPPADVDAAQFAATIATAEQSLTDWRGADHRQISAVLRRPLRRLLAELRRLPVEASSTAAGAAVSPSRNDS